MSATTRIFKQLILWAITIVAHVTPAAAGTLAAGEYFALQIRNGAVYAWGSNLASQLGDNTTVGADGNAFASQGDPGLLASLNTQTITSVAAGLNAGLALTSSGSIYQWGSTIDNSNNVVDLTTPTLLALPGNARAASIFSGRGGHIAIDTNGQMYQWTVNWLTDSQSSSYAPTTISLPGGVSAVSAAVGLYDLVVLGADGNVYVIGQNCYGSLGNGGSTSGPPSCSGPYQSTFVQVPLPGGVKAKAVAVGDYRAYALASNGALYGWGAAPVGDGTTTSRSSPVVISLPGGTNVVGISSGNIHNLALGSDGRLYGWGDNTYGEIGNGTTTSPSLPTLVNLPSGTTVTAFAAGLFTTDSVGPSSYAVSSTGTIYSWGGDYYGQLGLGSTGGVNEDAPIARTQQTISFPTPSLSTTQTTATLAATDSSGGPITYTSLTPSICTVSGSTLSLISNSAEYCLVDAAQSGSSSTEPVEEIQTITNPLYIAANVPMLPLWADIALAMGLWFGLRRRGGHILMPREA